MISSGVSRQKHPCVCLQYFETACRYDKIIGACEPEIVKEVIASFLDDRGLHHVSSKVRSRAAYLFSKFIRSQKNAVQNHVGQILIYLQDLLQLSPSTSLKLLTSDDQLFLFEAVGVLIVSGNHSNQDKRNFMQQLLANLADQFQKAMLVLSRATNEDEKRILIDFLNYLMAYASNQVVHMFFVRSRTSKAFSTQITMQSCQCEDFYLELMKVFLEAIKPGADFGPPLLNGLRQYLHRMIISLSDDNILPFFPLIIRKFVEILNESRLLQDFLTLIQQAVVKYKVTLSLKCHQEFELIYILVWKALQTPFDPLDEAASRDSIYLRRAYYNLLSCQVKNQQLDAWTNLTAENFDLLLSSLLDGCLMMKEPTVQKLCFNTIVRCLENFVKPSIVVSDTNNNQDAAPYWLIQFVYGRALAVCFIVPLKRGFDFADAQSIMVLCEIGSLFKLFYRLEGERTIEFLQTKLWPEMELFNLQHGEEFCLRLKTAESPILADDIKCFQKFLKPFFLNLSTVRQFD